MNVKKWLKTVFLFPAMLMLGVPEGLEAAAGEAETADADQQGEEVEQEAGEGEEGLDTQSEEDASAAEQGAVDAENTDQKEDEGKKGIKQKSLEERAAEIAEKKLAEVLTKREQEAQQRLEAEKKPFVELTPEQTATLNTNYVEAVARKAELEELIRIGDRSQSTIIELRKVEKWINDTEKWYADNEAKKVEWEAKQKESEQERTRLETEQREKAVRLQTASDVFRESKGIPQDAWDQGSQWFFEQLNQDKVLALKFADAYRRGDVAAVEFAFDYFTEHMGKAEDAALEQKKEAKTKLAPAVTGSVVPEADMKQLKELHAKAQKSGSEEDYLAFTALKNKLGVRGSIFAKK